MSGARGRARRIWGRLSGNDIVELRSELDEQRSVILGINHSVQQILAIVETLNHDVRSGSDEQLPLFQGYVERLRVDAETAISATQVIERQLARIEALGTPGATR